MRKIVIGIMLLVFSSSSAFAAILVQNKNGGVDTTVTTLEAARTGASYANTTIIVTSPLTQAQSNISGNWPNDRGLEFRFGGSITNSTAFTFTDGRVFSAWQGYVFKGSGSVTFTIAPFEVMPDYWDSGGADATAAINKAIQSIKSAHGTVTLGKIYPIAGRVLIDGSNIEIKSKSGSLGGAGFTCTASGAGLTVGVSGNNTYQNALTGFSISGGGVATSLIELIDTGEPRINHLALNAGYGTGITFNGAISGITEVTGVQMNGTVNPVKFINNPGAIWFKYCNFYNSGTLFSFAGGGEYNHITVTDSWFETYDYGFNFDITSGSIVSHGLKVRDCYFQNTNGGAGKTSRIFRFYAPALSSNTIKVLGLEWTGGVVYNTATKHYVDIDLNGTFGGLHQIYAKVDGVSNISPAGVTSWITSDFSSVAAKFIDINFGKNNYSTVSIPVQDNTNPIGGIEMLAVNDPTPSVASQASAYRTANTSNTVYTNFSGGTARNEILVFANDTSSTFDFQAGVTGTKLRGNGGANYNATIGDLLRCIYEETTTYWRCIILPVGG